ncbi:MAG: succinate dehydrogenase, hydrophobic membrane anchor protein [Alteromonadaceae bacterium]|nr:succinate dehydrogenase, hydrophobic membrane anchor protein [Alteromonadaceae bacterium]
MVTNQATIKRDGVQDWVSLRATAFIIMLFSFYIGWFFITTDKVTYDVWQGFFGSLTTKVFTLAALVSVMLHVRIGLWQVLTDYIKPAGLRAGLQYVLNIIAFVYVAVGLFVLWGV